MTEENTSQKKLTSKRRVFVEAYLKTWNATKAATIADYAHPGSQGHSLLKIIEIQAEIEKRLAEMAMDADEVLARLSEQASVNIGDFIIKSVYEDENGEELHSLKLNWDMIKEKGHLIKKITHNQYGPLIELHDGQAALVHMGRHHKLFTDKHEVENIGDMVIKVKAFTDEE